MTNALSLESQDLARDLYRLLKAIDASAWREARVGELHALFEQASERLERLLESSGPWPSDRVRARMTELSAAMDALPSVDAPGARAAWASFRAAMVPAYEALALALKEERLPVPSLRPTNHRRMLFHALSGLCTIVLVETVLGPLSQTLIMLAVTLTFWGIEAARHARPGVNDVLMRHLGPIAHPHERHTVNSSTWMATALLILSPIGSDLITGSALAVLAFADPAAGLVGRRWGRTSIRPGKSVQGTLAFLVVATLGPLILMSLAHPELALGARMLLALAAAVPGTLAELYLPRPDDNFSIPLASAAGVGLVATSMGLL